MVGVWGPIGSREAPGFYQIYVNFLQKKSCHMCTSLFFSKYEALKKVFQVNMIQQRSNLNTSIVIIRYHWMIFYNIFIYFLSAYGKESWERWDFFKFSILVISVKEDIFVQSSIIFILFYLIFSFISAEI